MSRLLLRPVLAALFIYLIALGATFNGILSPEIAVMTLAIMAITVISWLIIRWRNRWKWYRTPLDAVFLLWIGAFAVSLFANLDVARRIAIGLWYMSVYVGVWYILQDGIANRALSRDVLVDALLISGFIIVAFGYWQFQSWLKNVFDLGLSLSTAPRPVSVFGNPNFLSASLVVLIPFLFSRMVVLRRRFERILIALYAALALLLLFLTFSRAAWLGMAAGAAVWLGVLLAQKGMLSRGGWLRWWQQQTRFWKTTLLAGGLFSVIIALLVALIFIRSFSQAGRSADLRSEIYTAAIELFAEKPITGQGLFTFGRGLVRLPDVLPDKPHSHAHDAVLHIAAELGIVGLISLAATLIVMARIMRANLHSIHGRDQVMLMGAIGAVAAFAVHQLGDVPAMMPAIALTGLVALVVAIAPAVPKPYIARWVSFGFPAGMAALWLVILLTGFWSNRVYAQYVSVLGEAVKTNDYLEAAQRLQPVIDADPNLSLYQMEQAFLYGMQASKGDLDAARTGITAYQRFIALDSGYALAWANMAALEWQLDERDQAIQSIQEAIHLDSNVWQYHMNLAHYAEAVGDTATANSAYDQILKLNADVSLYPEFTRLASRRQASSEELEFSLAAQVALLLENGQTSQAVQLWKDNPQPDSSPMEVMGVLLALAEQDRDSALTRLARADALAANSTDQTWVHLGKLKVALFLGQGALAASELAEANKQLEKQPLDGDDQIDINIAYAQFLRLAIPRLFLPQVDYRVDDPVLLHLLADSGLTG